MLCLSRKPGEIIDIGPDIQVMVVEIRDGKARIGVTAPKHVVVNRREITDEIKREAETGGQP